MPSAEGTPRPRSPLPHADYAASTRRFEDAVTLPPACYTSSAFYAFEREVVFDREWFCVGRADQIPAAGDYFTLDYAGEPLVVVRDAGGAVRVLSAVCRHRAMLVAEGAGNCGTHLRCPYHWWTYALDGRLVNGPRMGPTTGFDRSEVALPTLPVEIWQGFVFATFRPDPEPLGPRLPGLTAMLANVHADQLCSTPVEELLHLPFNWKVMMENALEIYHNTHLHNRYVGYARGGEYVRTEADPGAVIAPVRRRFQDVGLNPTAKVLMPVIDTLTDDERYVTPFATVPPNLMLGWQADFLFWFLLLPEGPGSVSLRWSYCVPSSTMALDSFADLLAMTKAGVANFNSQDLPTAAAVQRGLGSRFAPRGHYNWEEEMLVQVNRWLVERYTDSEDPGVAAR